MPLVYYDRIKDSFTTTGTGTLTVANSAPVGSLPTSTVGNGNSTYFVGYTPDFSSWEVWAGTYTAAGTSVSRTTILASSNGGSAVNWPAGTKTLESVAPATFFTNALRRDLPDQTITGGANVTPLGLTTGNVTIDCGACPQQYIANTGPFSITAPSSDGNCILDIENGTGAGAVTWVGWTIQDGDALTTTVGNNFRAFISRNRSRAVATIKALQ